MKIYLGCQGDIALVRQEILEKLKISYRGIPVLHLPLVMVGATQGPASVELDVELVGVGARPIDVHTVVIMGVA